MKKSNSTGHTETNKYDSYCENHTETGHTDLPGLETILDIQAIQAMMEDFNQLVKVGMAIVDLKGEVLIAAGWQEICTKYHRTHPETCKYCFESDTILSKGIEPGNYKIYKCRNNMWDMATPIYVGDTQVGNLFIGQFFFDDEMPAIDLYRKQARRYGFDENDYLAALEKVPRLSREKVNSVMRFHSRFAQLISSLSFSNAQLLKTLDALKKSEAHYRNFFDNDITGDYLSTPQGKLLDCNPTFYKMLGYNSREEILATDMATLYPMPLDRNLFLEKLTKNRVLINSEIDLMRKDGRMIECIENVIGIFDEVGNLNQFMGYMIDITQSKEAEKQVNMLAETIKSISECVIIHSQDNRIMFVNEACVRTYGYSEKELLGKPVTMLHPASADPKQVEQITKKTLEGGWQGELMNRRKDGTEFPISLSTSAIKNSKGKTIALVGITTDITRQKLAIQALKESEEKFSFAFKSSPYAILITRLADGKIIEVNESLHQIIGFTREEIIDRTTSGLNLWVNQNDRSQIIADLLNHIPVHRRELLFRRKNGEIMTGMFSADLIIINNEQCILSSVDDITLQKNAEEALRKSEQRFRTMIQTSPDGIAIANMDGIVTELSDIACKMYGYNKPEEILGRHILEFLDKTGHEKAKKRIQELLEGKYNGVSEYMAIKKDGSRFFVEINSEILRDKDGKPTHLFFIERDITSRKHTEELLKKSEERFRLLINNSSDIIVVISPEGIQKFVSQAVENITGFTPEEVTNIHFSEIVHPDDFAEINRVWNEILLKPDKIYKGQYRHRHKTKGWVHLEAIGQSFVHEPDIQAIVISVRDMTERLKSEMALRESEMRLQNLINSTPDVICFKDGEGRWMIANEANLDLFQLRNVDYFGKTGLELSEATDPVYKNAFKFCAETDEKAWLAKAITISEESVLKPDGSLVLYEVIKVPVFHDDGSRKAIVILGRNVTERKRTELIHKVQYNIADAMVTAKNLNDLFEKVRNELKVLVDTSNIFIAFYDEKTDTLHSPFIINEKGDNISSWPAGNSLTGLVIHENKPLLLSKSEIAGLADQGIISLRGSRAEKWLGVPLENANKAFGAIVVQSFDNPNAYDQTSLEVLEIIAKQLSIYIEHTKSEELARKLSTAIVQSPESIVITDKQGIIEYINPKFTELTGFTPEEAIGKTPRILKSGEHPESFYNILWNTILSGQKWTGELHDKKKTGELYWESASISPIVDETGGITHFVAVKEDISEKKKMIEELVSARDKAEAANRLKSAFMNNISHEVRTPLNCILGFAEAITEEGITENDKQKYLKTLNSGSERLINTITSYMDIALIASGNMEVHKGKILPAELMQVLYQDFHAACKDKNLEFRLMLPENQRNLLINTDPELLKKIMNQLLDNSVKFTYNGYIHFGFNHLENEIEFFVSDTGTGIGKEFQGRIFEHFSQEDSALTRKFEGSGVGLAIVKGLCDLIGAKIRLISQPGYGTSFYLTLEMNEVETKSEKASEPPKEFKQLVVLVAEDEVDNFAYMEIVLQKINAIVIRARHGKEAVDLCNAHPEINMVFMDLKMPLMNGLEATRLIKSFRKDLPVVAVTAYAMSGDERIALDAGCDDYVSKPVKKDTLIGKLKKFGLIKS